MNTQVAEVHFTIIKLGRAIGTNPEAELTADTLILVNQGYAGLNILIKGRAGAGFDTGHIKFCEFPGYRTNYAHYKSGIMSQNITVV